MATMMSCARSGSAGRRAAASAGGRSWGMFLARGYRSTTEGRVPASRNGGILCHTLRPMTRTAKTANLLTVVLPPLIILACIVVFWNDVVGVHDLLVAGVMYLLTGFGITIGFHRMLTHRSFSTSKAVEYFFAAAGSMAVQGPVINWVADHRKHHAHTDEEGDPHSPHVGAGAGLAGAVRGPLHAHVGWLLTEHGRAERARYARDLVEDRGMRVVAPRPGSTVRRSAGDMHDQSDALGLHERGQYGHRDPGARRDRRRARRRKAAAGDGQHRRAQHHTTIGVRAGRHIWCQSAPSGARSSGSRPDIGLDTAAQAVDPPADLTAGLTPSQQ